MSSGLKLPWARNSSGDASVPVHAVEQRATERAQCDGYKYGSMTVGRRRAKGGRKRRLVYHWYGSLDELFKREWSSLKTLGRPPLLVLLWDVNAGEEVPVTLALVSMLERSTSSRTPRRDGRSRSESTTWDAGLSLLEYPALAMLRSDGWRRDTGEKGVGRPERCPRSYAGDAPAGIAP